MLVTHITHTSYASFRDFGLIFLNVPFFKLSRHFFFYSMSFRTTFLKIKLSKFIIYSLIFNILGYLAYLFNPIVVGGSKITTQLYGFVLKTENWLNFHHTFPSNFTRFSCLGGVCMVFLKFLADVNFFVCRFSNLLIALVSEPLVQLG